MNTLVMQELLNALISKASDLEWLYVTTKDPKYKEASKDVYKAVSEMESAIDVINNGF